MFRLKDFDLKPEVKALINNMPTWKIFQAPTQHLPERLIRVTQAYFVHEKTNCERQKYLAYVY